MTYNLKKHLIAVKSGIFKKTGVCFLISSAVVFFLFFTVNADAAAVHVNPFSKVNGREITLGEISDVVAPELIRKRIKEINLGTSPAPGKQKRIPGSIVEGKIRSLFPGIVNDMELSIPGVVVVERKGQEIAESELTSLFYSHVKEKVEGRAFRLKDVKIRGNRVVPVGSIILKIDDRNKRNFKGRITVTVYPEVDGAKAGSIYISGWIDLFDQVVTARRDIPRGNTIEMDDIGLASQNLSKAPPGLLRSPEKVKGTIAKSRIEKGAFIRDSMVTEAPVIKKGDAVKITAESEGLTVVAQGVAREDGRLGEQVVVENVRSNKNIHARVVGPGSVEVVF